MSSEKTLAWLGKHKERKALDLCEKLMEQITQTSEGMRDTVYSFCEEGRDMEKNWRGVVDKERSADELKSKILSELSKGSFPPLSREMIIRLMMTIDDIGDNAKAAAMKLSFLESEKVDEDIQDDLRSLSEYSHEAVKTLQEAFSVFLHDDIEAGLKKTGEVEKLEEKIDTFRAERMIPKIVKWADKSNNSGTANLLTEIENNIEEVADHSENSADVIRELAISSM